MADNVTITTALNKTSEHNKHFRLKKQDRSSPKGIGRLIKQNLSSLALGSRTRVLPNTYDKNQVPGPGAYDNLRTTIDSSQTQHAKNHAVVAKKVEIN